MAFSDHVLGPALVWSHSLVCDLFLWISVIHSVSEDSFRRILDWDGIEIHEP